MPNTLLSSRIGPLITGLEDFTSTLDAGEMGASTYDVSTSSDLWIHTISAVVAKISANTGIRFALYEVESNGDPSDRMGYTAAGTASSTTPTLYDLAVALSDDSPVNTFIKAPGGVRYAIGVLGTGGDYKVSFKDNPGSIDETFRQKAGLSQPPPDPFTFTSTATDRRLTAMAVGWVNVAPETPLNLAPFGTIDTTTPTFTSDFRDLNGAYGASSGSGIDSGDRITAYQVQLREVGETTLLWNQTYTSTAAEKTANATSRAYGGSTLSRGTSYEWRIRHADEFGRYSSFTLWHIFTINAQGFVTLDSDPTGKVLDNTPDFKGRWTHQTAANMTRVQVRLLTAAGTIITTGTDYDIGDVASSASPGTLFTVPWANTGFSTLEWGTGYRYQIRGKDATQWSDWSAERTFATDAAPAIPSMISPNDGTVRTSYPLLRCLTSDADDATSGLTVKAVITRPNATTVTVTLPYNATTGYFEYQTTSTEVSADGAYTWEPYAGDGTLWSGATTVEASAASALGAFTYATGPTVTITNPTDLSTVVSVSLGVIWTTTDQQAFKVLLTDDADDSVVYQNNAGDWTISTTSAHTVPIGYLRDGHDYTLVVTVRNSSLAEGSSSVSFSVTFTPPDAVANLQVTAVKIGTDPWETAIMVTWDASTADANDFAEYTVYRRAASGVDATEVVLARLGQAETQFVDYTPASDIEYTYGVRVVINENGLDDVESDVVEGAAMVSLGGLVLTRVGSPDVHRAILMYRLAGDPLGRQHTRRRPEAVFQPLSGGAPRTTQSNAYWWETTAEAVFVTDRWADASTRAAELEAMDAAGGTLCARDERGRKRFVTVSDSGLVLTDRRPLYFDVAVTLRGEQFLEGEA